MTALIETYRDFEIHRNPPFARQFKFGYNHTEYDGPEDNRRGHCRTVEECKTEIDEWYLDNPQDHE